MHLYAFGSVCRGEIDQNSDLDVLALVEGRDDRFDANLYSIYSYHRLTELWGAGNPFAWHLHLEARLLYSDDNSDYVKELGKPSEYGTGKKDCLKFQSIFADSYAELNEETPIPIYLMSNMFLGYRNFATCYSIQFDERPCFSRRAAFTISRPLQLPASVNEIFERSRILSTRGVGRLTTNSERRIALESAEIVITWMDELMKDFENG